MKLFFVIAVVAVCLGVTLAQQQQQQRQARRQQYRNNDQQFQRNNNNNQQNYNNNNQQQNNNDQQYNNNDQQYNSNTDEQYNNNNDQQYNQKTTTNNNNQQYNSQKTQQVNRQSSPSNDQYSTTAFPPIPIIRFQKEQTADGSYKTSYETGNNIIAEETGFLKNVGVDDKEALVQHGSYSYTAPDGTLINVQYTADEQGFRATGDHIPTPPPVPAEIQKSLDLIYEQIRIQAEEAARNPNARRPDEDDGSYNFDYHNNDGNSNSNNNNNNNNNNQRNFRQ